MLLILACLKNYSNVCNVSVSLRKTDLSDRQTNLRDLDFFVIQLYVYNC